MSRNKRILDHVREYLRGRRDTPAPRYRADRSAARLHRKLVTVHAYVEALERVLVGQEAHAGTMRGLRDVCQSTLSELDTFAQYEDQADLIDYVSAANAYIGALEADLTGEGAGEAKRDSLRSWYALSRLTIGGS